MLRPIAHYRCAADRRRTAVRRNPADTFRVQRMASIKAPPRRSFRSSTTCRHFDTLETARGGTSRAIARRTASLSKYWRCLMKGSRWKHKDQTKSTTLSEINSAKEARRLRTGFPTVSRPTRDATAPSVRTELQVASTRWGMAHDTCSTAPAMIRLQYEHSRPLH